MSGTLAEPAWLMKLEEAGFSESRVVRRERMGEERLSRYPVYRSGLLERVLGLVEPERRREMLTAVTVVCRKGR